jgi:AraC-like DNA-binding protein
LAPWQARRAIDYVEANLADTISVEKMAELTRLSHSYFSRAFRSDFGESPYAYVIRRRIDHAKEMILSTNESLAYIARACGLSDQPHLTRLFRRIVGTSPANWRRQNASRNRVELAEDSSRQPSAPGFAYPSLAI